MNWPLFVAVLCLFLLMLNALAWWAAFRYVKLNPRFRPYLQPGWLDLWSLMALAYLAVYNYG